MKKIVLGLILIAFVAGSSFAKSNFKKLGKRGAYLIYKVEIRKDIDREFYSKAFMCPELVNEAHRSGLFGTRKSKAIFKGFDFDKEYCEGNPVGEFTYAAIANEKGTSEIYGVILNFFGSAYQVYLPVSNTGKETSTLSFDAKAEYVYGGTFVYDFVDGLYEPKLVKVIDEYDAAKEWVNEMAGEEVELCRASIE